MNLNLFSQRDPVTSGLLLPFSDATVYDDGCFACMMGTLGQAASLQEVLAVKNGFVSGGLAVERVLAEGLGMTYRGTFSLRRRAGAGAARPSWGGAASSSRTSWR